MEINHSENSRPVTVNVSAMPKNENTPAIRCGDCRTLVRKVHLIEGENGVCPECYRRRYLRRKKQESRSRLSAVEGGVTITVRMNREQHAQMMRCLDCQRGPAENFILRALLTGAAFVANSGTPRGKKVRGTVAVGLPKVNRKGPR